MFRFLLAMCFASLFGEILEISHFDEMEKYVDQDSIVLLDIDDTLAIPAQSLGNEAWFDYRLKGFLAEGLALQTAIDRALIEWEAIRHITQMELVEPNTANILARLQEKGVAMMGLTSQGLALASRTVMQLQGLSVNLSKTAPSPEDHCLSVQGHTVLYRQGILFVSGQKKGVSFFKLCDQMGLHPKKIVAVDDKLSHLKNIETMALSRGIEFTGLRYGFIDAKYAQFCPEIVEYQFEHSTFKHIVSDEEAKMALDLLKEES